MEIKRLDQSGIANFRNLIEVFTEVFENSIPIPNDQYLSKLLSDPDFMVFVAKIHDKVVGSLTIYVLHQYYSEKPLAYIYDVGVAPEFQRKGIGKALIIECCNFCKANGFDEVYVEAESEDKDAVNFYRKTKYSTETLATHFSYSFTD
ncbi:GNAT family N-acetyltransferase [Rhodocytophaga aerolata]|uniref:GNAT family N-acetyltransferase n=1 Tax=Rhodocytophaga aerolata TaxID=455078 RepID=A0ABT8RHX9_9BACT|nr:GNAT family N-acetyltransferase [Rhodocytophaga aerolata]MDO1451717.1 GNAT family N-acetyltransferase [Rhodocytophaga aerolata]